MVLKIMQSCMPEFIKKKMLKQFFRLTAEAFRKEMPELKGLCFDECLTNYALFTREQAETYLQQERLAEEVRNRLYQNSCAFGKKLARGLGVKNRNEAVEMLKAAYKLIGIEFHYVGEGEFVIEKCFFSRFYSGEVCAFISSLDEGLAAGLSVDGRMCFHQRITEGACYCKGSFNGRALKWKR